VIFVARLRSLWRGLRRDRELEAEMADEFRAHIEMRADDLERSGVSREAALRQARIEFGSVPKYRDEARASRGLRWFDDLRISWLDVKLGLRMLRKYPGLTLTGGFAMAFAIAVGASTFEVITQVLRPRLPLDEGDRIVRVSVSYRDGDRIEGQTAFDFMTWREELVSIEDAGAYLESFRTLVDNDGLGRPVFLAETTATAFSAARVPALLGRSLISADEAPGTPPVVVIGYDLWQSHFGGDSALVGREVVVGGVRATVVGVMPEGFRFPVWHEVWMPLRVEEMTSDPARSPQVEVFGRLAPGVSREAAEVEVRTLGQRLASAIPDGRTFRGARVERYALGIETIWFGPLWVGQLAALSTNLPPLALLALICANVALLVFARTAAREGEIAVRMAMGATRRRIVTQLFTETLVLGMLAAAVGLAAAGFVVRWAFSAIGGEILEGFPLPFWFRGSLSGPTVVYSFTLALLASAISGALPALAVTTGTARRLKESSAGGGGLQLGGAWAGVIVIQVAVSVVAPAVTWAVIHDEAHVTPELPLPAGEFLSAELDMDRLLAVGPGDAASAAEFTTRYGSAQAELERRLLADPAVAGVTFSGRLPLEYHPWSQIEVDGGAVEPPDERGHRAGLSSIDPDYFEVLGVALLAGRGFTGADVAAKAPVVIVNQPFVEQVLGGGSPIGRHVRFVADEGSPEPRFDGPWHEIVGVAQSLGTRSDYGFGGIYLPASPDAHPLNVIVHVREGTEAFGPRLHAIAQQADPALTLRDLTTLDRTNAADVQLNAFWVRILLIVSVLALLLSLAGIFSVFSFTVARRTREIGIRVALGADSRTVFAAIFARPVSHVVTGVLIGGALAGGLRTLGAFTPQTAAAVLVYVTVMFAVCMLACIVPTRRALAITPTEVLKGDA
jgi:predicted permease